MPLNLSPTQVAFNARGDGKFNTPFDAQVNFFKQKLNLPSEHYDDILKEAHDRAFIVAGATKADLLNDFHTAIEKSIRDGKSIQWFRKEFDSIVQKHGWEGWTGSDSQAGRDWRTRVIYQTNLSSSYAAGRYSQLTDPDLLKSRPYWKYIHNDTVQHPRPLHQSWSGTVLRYDDPWWKTHFCPNGWGCRCRITAVRASEFKDLPAPDDGTYTVTDRFGNKHVLPAGIDYGWDYAPGASVSSQLTTFVESKAKSLPGKIASDFIKELTPILNKPSVSDALILSKSGPVKNTTLTVLKEIDSLHSIGQLPKIPVKPSTSLKFQGRYTYYRNSGQPVEIALSKVSVNPELTMAHEIGHFIDHQAFSKVVGYSSISDDLFADFRKAVDNSNATVQLKETVRSTRSAAERKLGRYYLDRAEQWARAYAQWTALRSNNSVMIDQVTAILNSKNASYKLSQWHDTDFEQIAVAIDSIFKTMGWLK